MRDQSTYYQSLGAVIFDASELRDFLYIDKSLWLIESLLHQNREMGPTGKNLRLAGVLFEQRAGFGDCGWFQVIKVLHEIKNLSRQDAKAQSKENKISFPNLAPFAPLRE